MVEYLDNQMTLYVQSRGTSQEDDYRWLKIEETAQMPQTPSFLNQSLSPQYPSLVSLIDSHKFSLILARDGQHFILLVTGLESTHTDFMGRKIRNSVVWIAPVDNQAQIRALTVSALQGTLDEAIASTIVRDGDSDYGFTVDTSKLTQLTQNIELQYHNNANPVCKLGYNSLESRQEIALEVQANSFPATPKLLVVVTTIKSAEDLQKFKVWRGLSNRIESKDLMAITPTSSTFTTQKKTLLRTTIIATAAIIVLTVFLIL